MKEQLSVDHQVVEAIFIKYVQAKMVLENNNSQQTAVLEESSVSYANSVIPQQNLQNSQNHVQIVDTVLALLPKNEYSYIIRTFLVKSNQNWWKKHYSARDYKNLRKNAIKRFLYLYLI